MNIPKTAAVASKSGVQLSVSLRRPLDDGQQTVSYFPLHILLARPRPVPTPNGETQRPYSYGSKRACKLTRAHTVGSPQPKFVLPDINKLLTEFKSGSLAVLLVRFADIINQTVIDLTEDHIANEGYCSGLQSIEIRDSNVACCIPYLRVLGLYIYRSKMLDDFVDVTQNEKQMMHLWNSFIRKNWVLADAHIPWACEAFSTQHGEDLIQIDARITLVLELIHG